VKKDPKWEEITHGVKGGGDRTGAKSFRNQKEEKSQGVVEGALGGGISNDPTTTMEGEKRKEKV